MSEIKINRFLLLNKKPNRSDRRNIIIYNLIFMLVSCSLMLMMISFDSVQCRDKGDDIIMTKGKLIVRGGKGKGNLILDTGVKSQVEHGVIPIMAMHHFNPYSFYPMQHHHQQHQPMMMHPIYFEDYSAMHQQQQQQQYHQQEEPQQHYEHHHQQSEMHQQQHEPVQQHHQMEVEQQPEMHHLPQMDYEHQPLEHYEQEPMQGHHEEEQHHSYETNPMMQMMMHNQHPQHPAGMYTSSMAASPPSDQLQQLATLQAYQNPLYLHQMQQINGIPAGLIQNHASPQISSNNQPQQQQSTTSATQTNDAQPAPKKLSLLSSSANNPLISFIKPLFKRDPNKTKKP